jgi:hypothetical protein
MAQTAISAVGAPFERAQIEISAPAGSLWIVHAPPVRKDSVVASVSSMN